MSNTYIENLCKKYKIKGKEITLSSTYYPPYNTKKEYTITIFRDVGIGIPMAQELYRSDNIDDCYKFIDSIKKGTRKI